MSEQATDCKVIVRLENGMDGHIWREADGWYGEVSDQGDYCQGCAWAEETRQEAVDAVTEEVEYILAVQKYYDGGD